MSLTELAFKLNAHTSAEDTRFDAVLSANGVLEVSCSNNEEFPINIVKTDTQLLAITPLFNLAEVQADKVDELNKELLFISPAIPLSSVGRQGDTYILFGAMALDTIFENIVHELEVQAENTLDVLQAVEPLLL
ncbi:MAG: DUF2170 family protein [Gammaproteobacteria bacterium]|nr:DUF2170 family protein [Gammaproteobacteria bacterium]MBQ0840392.1 DUF2170 family protein [Gammaproteobacteria bacterium]